MALESNLERIRRYVRDPDSKLFTDSFLTSLFNDVQAELQTKTRSLSAVMCIRVPPEIDYSVIYEWERAYTNSAYKVDRVFDVYQQSYYNVTSFFETQNINGLDVDVPMYGPTVTQPFENWHVTSVKDVVEIRFPKNFHTAIFFAYDNVSLPPIDKSSAMNGSADYRNETGDPIGYYRNSIYENKFILYPRPTSANHSAGVGGMDLYAEGDTEDTTTGMIVRRTGTTILADTGMPVELVPTDDNVLLVYTIRPTDLVNDDDESDFPDWMQKYVEFGVAARALVANTDGRMKNLATYWDTRYQLGVKAIQRWKSIRYADVDFCLITKDARTYGVSKKPLPKLPSEYPQWQ